MVRTSSGIALLSLAALGAAVVVGPIDRSRAAEVAPHPRPKAVDPVLATSAIKVVFDANGGKVPATGEQLWSALSHIGGFAQLPVVFSAVRLDSGLSNPRVVIAPNSNGLCISDSTGPNLVGRLFLAANMEPNANRLEPKVTSVEVISWNTASRRFDFGVIENMGGGSPEFHMVDSGRCVACHKNRGPILGAKPWSNTVKLDDLRLLVSNRLVIATSGSWAAAAKVRDRIDGMALATPEGETVDQAVFIGRQMRVYRETFQLMNRSTAGRQAFVGLLLAIAASGELENNNPETARALYAWGNDSSYSYRRFITDWLTLLKGTNSGVLTDFAPFSKFLIQKGPWEKADIEPLPALPPATAVRSQKDLSDAKDRLMRYRTDLTNIVIANERAMNRIVANLEIIVMYDKSRSEGKAELPSSALPSNPKAFITELPTPPKNPANLLSPGLLAITIGITRGDRQFIAHALDEAADLVHSAKVTPRTLAKAVFEGPEFSDVLAGGPLPDRDEFKDRFVAGLDKLLKTKYYLKDGFTPDRKEYAFGPRFDPKAVLPEVAVVPTTACLRCHDVRPTGKARAFETIPALAFDPLDKVSRDAWLKTAPKARKHEVLTRFQVRLFKDGDMPPKDAPEHALFRVKEVAAFDEFKKLIEQELGR